MASITVPSLAARPSLRKVTLGFVFVSSLRSSGHALIRTNSIPAVMPSMMGLPSAMATRGITNSSIAIVPYERINKNASINKLSSCKAAAASQPVYNEVTVESVNAVQAIKMTLSDEIKDFDRIEFPDSTLSEAGGDGIPTVSISARPTPEPETGTELQTPTMLSQLHSRMLLTLGRPSTTDSEPSMLIPVTLGSSTPTQSDAMFSIDTGHQALTGSQTDTPPSLAPSASDLEDLESQASRETAFSSRTTPMTPLNTTRTHTASAIGSVTSEVSSLPSEHNYLHYFGQHAADNSSPVPLPLTMEYISDIDLIAGILATRSVADAAGYPCSISLSRSPTPEPEPATLELPVPAPVLKPLGVRQKHSTWHSLSRAKQRHTETATMAFQHQATKRCLAQTELDDDPQLFKKRFCLGGPSTTANSHHASPSWLAS